MRWRTVVKSSKLKKKSSIVDSCVHFSQKPLKNFLNPTKNENKIKLTAVDFSHKMEVDETLISQDKLFRNRESVVKFDNSKLFDKKWYLAYRKQQCKQVFSIQFELIVSRSYVNYSCETTKLKQTSKRSYLLCFCFLKTSHKLTKNSKKIQIGWK